MTAQTYVTSAAPSRQAGARTLGEGEAGISIHHVERSEAIYKTVGLGLEGWPDTPALTLVYTAPPSEKKFRRAMVHVSIGIIGAIAGTQADIMNLDGLDWLSNPDALHPRFPGRRTETRLAIIDFESLVLAAISTQRLHALDQFSMYEEVNEFSEFRGLMLSGAVNLVAGNRHEFRLNVGSYIPPGAEACMVGLRGLRMTLLGLGEADDPAWTWNEARWSINANW